MKRFIDPMPSGFAPLTWDEGVLPVMTDIYDIIDNLLNDQDMHSAYGAGDSVIIEGGVVSLNGGGPNIDITAGIAFLTKQKKFVRFTAQTNVADPYYGVFATATTQKTFKDSVLRDYIINETLSLSASVPGDNNYVKFSDTSSDNTRYLKDLMAGSMITPKKTGTFVLGDFTQGVTAVNSPAAHEYIKMGPMVFLYIDINVDTNNNNIRFTIPDGLKSTGFATNRFWNQNLNHGGTTGTDVGVQLANVAGEDEIQINDSANGAARAYKGLFTFYADPFA